MKQFYRGLIYGLGVVILGLGISLNTKTGLGMPSFICVSYIITQVWGLSFGFVNFLFYFSFVVAEILLDRKAELRHILQIPFCFAISACLEVFGNYIPYNSADHSLAANIGMLLLAVCMTGIGITMTVNMRLVSNPGDGIIVSLARRLKWEQGFTKNIFDIVFVSIACAMSLWLCGSIIGVGLGTLIAMIGIGRVVSIVNRLFLARMCRLAGLPVPE